MDTLLGVLFIIVCLLLIVVVLLQKGRGGGLGSAFGGAASSAFGTRIGDVFTWVTIVLVALFLVLAIATTMIFRPAPGLVARPVFDPPPSAYTDYSEAISVKIRCSTADVEIYYTTDGSQPTRESETSDVYDSAIRVTSPTVLKAMAYRDGGWRPSAVQEGFYGPAPTTAPADALVATQPAELPVATDAAADVEAEAEAASD